MFNNYALTDDYKMEFNKKTGLYEKAILMKQGFTNFQYILTNKKGAIDFETQLTEIFIRPKTIIPQSYIIKETVNRYDRAIGIANTNSEAIQN